MPKKYSEKITSMSFDEYIKLLADLNDLKAFAKTIYEFRRKMTPEKIEEFYKSLNVPKSP